MGRPPLPMGRMTDAEYARRYRAKHRERINRARRKATIQAAPALPEGKLLVRLTQLDAPLPNLALARLAGYHRERGDQIFFSRSPYRSPTEPDYHIVYG